MGAKIDIRINPVTIMVPKRIFFEDKRYFAERENCIESIFGVI